MCSQSQDLLKNETELLFKMKQGEVYAFDIIYKHYSSKIYRNILRLVKEENIAEEILQDVFMKVWERRETLDVETSFKSYLFKIAHNLTMDLFRRAAFDKNLRNHLSIVSNEGHRNTEQVIDFKDTYALLQEAIEMLPPQRKKIYILCKIEGKTYDEVSKMLNISTSTISDHIVKATKAVKSRFEDNDYAIVMAAIVISFHNN